MKRSQLKCSREYWTQLRGVLEAAQATNPEPPIVTVRSDAMELY